MNTQLMTCPLCGHRFDLSDRGACGGCPLVRGCETFCCPACGYVDVNPSRTTIGRWLMARGRRGLHGAAELAATGLRAAGQNQLTLVDVPVGWSARIAGIEGLPASRKQQLSAYGLLSGDWIRVIQHTPVTVAVVDHTELALEADLARCILIDACELSADPSTGNRPGRRGFGRRRRAGARNQPFG
jgi:Fe2+ transport system protein FeoA